MKLDLSRIPAIAELLRKPAGAHGLYHNGYFDTEKGVLVVLNPFFCFVFENLEFEDADRRLYAVPLDILRAACEEGSLVVTDSSVRVGRTVASIGTSKVGVNSESIILDAITRLERTREQCVDPLPEDIVEGARELIKLADTKNPLLSYVYINKDIALTTHGSSFIAVRNIKEHEPFALSLSAAQILMSVFGNSMHYKLKQASIVLSAEGFYGETNNITKSSMPVGDLPSRESINERKKQWDKELQFSERVRRELQGLLKLVSTQIKQDNCSVRFTSGSVQVVNKKLKKAVGFVDQCEWEIDGYFDLDLLSFLKVYAADKEFAVSYASNHESVDLVGLRASEDKLIIMPAEFGEE